MGQMSTLFSRCVYQKALSEEALVNPTFFLGPLGDKGWHKMSGERLPLFSLLPPMDCRKIFARACTIKMTQICNARNKSFMFQASTWNVHVAHVHSVSAASAAHAICVARRNG